MKEECLTTLATTLANTLAKDRDIEGLQVLCEFFTLVNVNIATIIHLRKTTERKKDKRWGE